MAFEEKWKANREKVAFVKEFPGLLVRLSDCVGRQVRRAFDLKEEEGRVVLFDDDTFLVLAGTDKPEPALLLAAVRELRPLLEERHRAAYEELDRLAARDAELTRRARINNILGAIRNNIERAPELMEEIPKLLEELKGRDEGSSDSDQT